MKKLVFLIVLMVFFTPVFSQEMFQKLTDKYADREGFSATMITSDMFDVYLRKKNVEKESPVYETLKKLDNILVASQSTFGQKEETDISGIHSEMLDFYKKASYSLFKTEKRMGEDVKVYLKKSNSKITSLALVTASSASVKLIEMNGEIEMSSLAELSRILSVRGLENLYKVNGGASFHALGGTFTAPDFMLNEIYSKDFFSGEKLKELQEQLKDQAILTDEQRKKIEQRTQEMFMRQKEMAEKYREMSEKYRRQPIFLSSPGDTNTVYYINGEKVKSADVKKLDPEEIESVNVNKSKGEEKSSIEIKTKQK